MSDIVKRRVCKNQCRCVRKMNSTFRIGLLSWLKSLEKPAALVVSENGLEISLKNGVPIFPIDVVYIFLCADESQPDRSPSEFDSTIRGVLGTQMIQSYTFSCRPHQLLLQRTCTCIVPSSINRSSSEKVTNWLIAEQSSINAEGTFRVTTSDESPSRRLEMPINGATFTRMRRWNSPRTMPCILYVQFHTHWILHYIYVHI